MLLVNCPRCETKNSLKNDTCEKCGFGDVSGKNIVDKGLFIPLLLSLLSIVIFPINVLVGLGLILVILIATINAWVLKIFGIFFPIVIIGKLFDYFVDISWGEIGQMFLISTISIIIYEFVVYAYTEKESLPYKILRFIFMFLFPPLLTFLNLYYYEPRKTIANISRQIKNNLTSSLTQKEAKQALMEKYKKRDGVLIDGSIIITTGQIEDEYTFLDSTCYKYFANDSDFVVYLAYIVVIVLYILYFFFA